MNNNGSNLPKVLDDDLIKGVDIDDNNLMKHLNRYEQDMLREYSNIDKFLNKQLNLQEVTLSKINQMIQNNDAIRYNLEINDFQKNLFFKNVNWLNEETLKYLNIENKYIWRNESGVIYYQLENFGNKIKCTSDDELLRLFDFNIRIYNKIEEVILDKYSPILVKSLLKVIKDDAFYPLSFFEFFKIGNINYRNVFKRASYVPPGFNRLSYKLFNNKSIVNDFIKNLLEDDDAFRILIKSIVYCLYKKKKTNLAFILIGDENSIDILINEIIKPIFITKNEYFCLITDELLEKKSNEKIIENKIFYHVNNLSEDNLKSKRVNKLLLDIIKPNKISPENAILNNETYVWGELFITSSKNNPYSILEDIYSKCIVIEVKNLKSILKKMNRDKISLLENIQKDILNFSNFLLNHDVLDMSDDINIMQQKEVYKNLSKMINGIILTKNLEQKINNFVIAIVDKRIDFFANIEYEKKELYDELIHNFEENMIAQPLLSEYFNIVNEDIIFEENNYLLDILKQEYKMFRETPDDKSKYKNKKRYKIF